MLDINARVASMPPARQSGSIDHDQALRREEPVDNRPIKSLVTYSFDLTKSNSWEKGMWMEFLDRAI